MEKLDVVSTRLVKDAPLMSKTPITKPKDAVYLIGEELCQRDREVLCVINLKTNGIPISCNYVTMGTLNQSLVHPREIFKSSILSNAESMVIVHNHVSGKLEPSEDDTKITERMVDLCDMMGIPLLDHIIVGGDNTEYFSFREKEILPYSKKSYTKDYQEIKFKEEKVAEELVRVHRRGR